MAFADPEAKAAVLTAIEANAKAFEDEPGAVGAAARAAEAYKALSAWLIAEHERGTALHHIGEAAANVVGSFLASASLSIARPGAELVVHERTAAGAEAAGRHLIESGNHRFFTPMHPGQRQ